MFASKTVALGFASLLLGVVASVAREAETADFYVSLQGNDRWSGALAEPNADGSDGPLATMQHAIQQVAAMRKKEPARSPR